MRDLPYGFRIVATTAPKTCATCGQVIPVALGQVVEGRWAGRAFRGIVSSIDGSYVRVKEFGTDKTVGFNRGELTRLHIRVEAT